ncbi:mitogen-activated protein kinase-binding protein 1 isoform X8 [Galleria mellonella]|uniref:Mitogen-activated protein kinase-binding protein 1 isoform X8 n=1 Tax=Galleria mellonella TaxID=7137 RepID=A0ABM3MCC3_GALME|nr:mitogen-activated protein kinase-binding protein 1 isoform X8 [Galleria mellonella]
MEAGYIPVSTGNAGNAPPPSVVAPATNVIRAPSLKRGKMEEAISDRIKLESVLGLTVGSNAALDCDPNTEIVAYPAGCTVVLYNVRKNRQSHVLNASRKSVTCVAFSPDGRYLATGECGHAPAVRVWDLHDPTASGAVQIAEFPGHTHGVSCVAFSTSSKYLVSVGSQHDMIVNVWDWRANLKLASNKVSSRVKAVSFSENGNYFVTVGFRHVKFWYLEYSRNAKFKEPVPLMGRSAILGEQKDNEFCDVVCGRGAAADSTYAITRGGLLCEFNGRRLLDKWVELRTTSANCMAIGNEYIFVGCAEGIVRCFSPSALQYITTLPRTHYLGVDVAQGSSISHMFTQPQNARYPDAVALTYDERNHKLTCVYNDHSLYVWDVRDIKRVGKCHSALYHSACIWGVDVAPSGGPLPPGTFLTCSSDDTVRAWNLSAASNIYSNELTKVIYVDPELKFLKDVDLTATSDKDKSKSYDDKTGVRCVRVSPDGAHVAAGDRAGNVHVHRAGGGGGPLHTLEAHDAEVLCLEYSARPRLLASASRDRLIHVFRVDQGYQIMQTLDDHSSSITAVRFLSTNRQLQMVSCGADKTILFRQIRTNPDGSYQFARGQNVSGRTTLYDMEVDAGGRHILTACQDRNVRVYSAAQGRHTKTFRGTTAEDGTLIKVALDSSGIYLATSSTDKILSVYDYYSGECMATMYGHSEIVTGLRFTPDCQHLVSASGDGCIFVWRVPHDMVVTMRARLAQQAIRQGKKVSAPTNGMSALDSESDSHFGSPPRDLPDQTQYGTPIVPDYTLRIGKLPTWAKKSLGDSLPTAPPTPAAAAPPAHPPRGKWATRVQPEKRVDSDGSKDSSLDSGTDTRYIEKRREQTNVKQRPRSLNLTQLPRVEALFRHFDNTMRKTYDILMISPRAEKVTIVSNTRTGEGRTRHHTDDSSLGSFKYEDQESTEHDGDIEDISDGERTSSSERGNRPTYYPGNNEVDTPGEFMVNAMDAEELRQSVRRSKRWKAESPRLELPPSGTSLSGSGHDSDDDEVSTPSGDNAERNPLSGSCESIDTAGRREKYIKSAFDSLSGADLDTTPPGGNTSLSSQHLSRAPVPAARPSAPAPAPRTPGKHVDPEAARKREELTRRILETRRQLESVAFRSNLKSSQSTTDLSYVPEKDGSRRARPISMAVPSNTRQYVNRNHMSSEPEEESAGMRRAISLSDLAVKPMPAPRTPQATSKPAQPTAPATKSPSGFVRPTPRYNNKSNMTRSSSVGVLNNQSDSESDPQPSRQQPPRAQGLMRPTISSMNKVAANTARRRGLANAYSAVSLSTGGQEESSSEAEERTAEKPAVPPRPRAGSVDQRRIGRSGSERDLSAKAREVTARLTANTRQRPKQDTAPEANMSSSQLCSALTEQLTKTACKVVQLYTSLQREPNSAADISGLEAAIVETQKVLRSAVMRNAQNGGEALSSLSSNDGDYKGLNVDSTRQKLEHLVSKGSVHNSH